MIGPANTHFVPCAVKLMLKTLTNEHLIVIAIAMRDMNQVILENSVQISDTIMCVKRQS